MCATNQTRARALKFEWQYVTTIGVAQIPSLIDFDLSARELECAKRDKPYGLKIKLELGLLKLNGRMSLFSSVQIPSFIEIGASARDLER